MTQKRTKSKSQKVVQVIARYFIKATGAIVYRCRSSKGDATYCTTIVNGRATGCTCPSYKPCKHMEHCEKLERERTAAAQVTADDELVSEVPAAEVVEHQDSPLDEAIHEYLNPYAIIGPEKMTSDKRGTHAYGCCGHIVKVEHAGQLCGACLCG